MTTRALQADEKRVYDLLVRSGGCTRYWLELRLDMPVKEIANVIRRRQRCWQRSGRNPTDVDALLDALCAYVDQHGLEHDLDCPEDDTCECPLVRALSKALDAALEARRCKEVAVKFDHLCACTHQESRHTASHSGYILACEDCDCAAVKCSSTCPVCAQRQRVEWWLKDRSFVVNPTTIDFYWDKALADSV